jgi:quinol monooxygenase YgiN
MAAFRKLFDENSQMSREREPGCGACASPCSYPCILLYEIYDSRPAFDVHLRSLYFAAFYKTSANWS